MARGRTSEIGDTRTAPNGYHYTKVESVPETGKPGWRLTHHLVAEKKIGRPLREDERVEFVTGNKKNLTPDNVRVVEKGQGSIRRKLAQLKARRAEIDAQIQEIEEELAAGRKVHHDR